MDDSDLYTGVQNPHSNMGTNPIVNDEIEKQKVEIATLLPSVEAIMKTVNEERIAASDFRSYMAMATGQPWWKFWGRKGITDEYRARELYFGFLDRFEEAIQNKVAPYLQEEE